MPPRAGAALTCRDLIEFLEAYRSGALPAAERATFDDHLAICPDCLGYLAAFDQTVSVVRAAGASDADALADAPESLIKAVLAARRGPR